MKKWNTPEIAELDINETAAKFPGNGHGGQFPGNAHGGQFPGNAHGGQFPGGGNYKPNETEEEDVVNSLS